MRNILSISYWAAAGLVCLMLLFPAFLKGEERFQIELYGGVSFINPKDFNLLSRAEQQYNDIYFVQHLRYYGGYFVNEFPEIKMALPAGIRLKYRVSETLAFSLGVEGFIQHKEKTIEGTFSYSPSWSESHTKKYDPFRLELSGYAVMGGIHYRIPVGEYTDLEIGAATGWAVAHFDSRSAWSYTIDYYWDEEWNLYTVDNGTLEGSGSGNGFAAQGLLRLNRMLGRRLGFFVETAYTYCRIKSIEGTGREIRQGIPGEKTWEGSWGIKKEEINMPWGSATVSVPTNYWEGWIVAQRERDFILNLSGLRLSIGIYLKL